MRPQVRVVGSGPNGLAAALVLQRAGCQVAVAEARERAGGCLATTELTLPGHRHDVCAAIHPLARASPFFRELALPVEWVRPRYALAHPFPDGGAVLVTADLEGTAGQLEGNDGRRYRGLLAPLVAAWPRLAADVLAPLHVPRAGTAYARFAAVAAFPAAAVARSVFRGPRARALFAGLAAHGTLPLERSPSAGFGLVLAACAHADGWPLVRGGSQALADALVALLRAAGGTLNAGCRVDSLDQLRDAAAAVLDVSPRELLRLAGGHARRRIRTRLAGFRYGCGVHKVEWALSGPVPWRAGECAEAGTVHLGGGLEEISAALRAANAGRAVERPFVLFGQPTQFDESRAPPGGHNAWAYCAVPAGTDADYTTHIEAQVERYAPGFRELIVARHVLTAQALEAHNGNLVGGSLAGAVQSLPAFFLGPFRFLRSPYRTPMRGVYLCSAVTPPGPGVHGMCGWHAAHRVLRDLGRKADGLFSDFGPSIL